MSVTVALEARIPRSTTSFSVGVGAAKTEVNSATLVENSESFIMAGMTLGRGNKLQSCVAQIEG